MMIDYRNLQPHSVWTSAIARPDAAASRTWFLRRQEELLDEALEGTFPASDPVGVIRVS